MKSHTLLNDSKLAALRHVLDVARDVSGDLAELGVYRGGVAKVMSLHSPHKTVRLFDTFEGIPEHSEADAFHKPGEFACSLADVQRHLADCHNVVFHPGLFPATAAGDAFSVVHLDADLYQSTLDGLRYFWPRLSIGGAIVLDDWHWRFCEGVTRAVEEFFAGDNSPRREVRAENQLILWKR